MRRTVQLGLIGVLCALSLAWPQRVAAQAAPQRVRLNIGPTSAEGDAMAAVISELLERLAVEVVFDRAGHDLAVDPSAYVAKVAVDLRQEGRALLFVEDSARNRLLVKRIARAPGREELAREEIGHIALAAVEAIIAGASIGAPKEEALRALSAEEQSAPAAAPAQQALNTPPPAMHAPQPEPDERRPRAPGRGLQLSGALWYEIAALGDEPGVAHGPALALAVRTPWPLRLGALGSVQYRFPIDVEGEPIGLSTQVFALRALATVEHGASSRIALRFGLGGGADIARLEPALAPGGTAETTAKRTLALAVARALAGVDWRAGRWLSLWLAVAADFDLDEAQYVVVDGGGHERTVSEPWRVRPSLLVGAALP